MLIQIVGIFVLLLGNATVTHKKIQKNNKVSVKFVY